MQVLGPADQPFITEDSILSFALYLAQSPFYDDNQPCVNYYTINMLKQLGYKGMVPTAAALKAVEDKRCGKTNYIFRSPEGPLLQAYEDQKKVLQGAEGTVCDLVKNLMDTYAAGARTYGETMMRLVCTIVHMRQEFVTMWQKYEPLIQIDNQTKSSTEKLVDGSTMVSHSGFKFIGARASKETQKRLGL